MKLVPWLSDRPKNQPTNKQIYWLADSCTILVYDSKEVEIADRPVSRMDLKNIFI